MYPFEAFDPRRAHGLIHRERLLVKQRRHETPQLRDGTWPEAPEGPNNRSEEAAQTVASMLRGTTLAARASQGHVISPVSVGWDRDDLKPGYLVHRRQMSRSRSLRRGARVLGGGHVAPRSVSCANSPAFRPLPLAFAAGTTHENRKRFAVNRRALAAAGRYSGTLVSALAKARSCCCLHKRS